jgi:hypothetical protein
LGGMNKLPSGSLSSTIVSSKSYVLIKKPKECIFGNAIVPPKLLLGRNTQVAKRELGKYDSCCKKHDCLLIEIHIVYI